MKICRQCRIQFREAYSIGERVMCSDCGMPFVTGEQSGKNAGTIRCYIRPGLEWRTLTEEKPLTIPWDSPLTEEELA